MARKKFPVCASALSDQKGIPKSREDTSASGGWGGGQAYAALRQEKYDLEPYDDDYKPDSKSTGGKQQGGYQVGFPWGISGGKVRF